MTARYDIFETSPGSWTIYDRYQVGRVPREFPTHEAAMEYLKDRHPNKDVVEVSDDSASC